MQFPETPESQKLYTWTSKYNVPWCSHCQTQGKVIRDTVVPFQWSLNIKIVVMYTSVSSSLQCLWSLWHWGGKMGRKQVCSILTSKVLLLRVHERSLLWISRSTDGDLTQEKMEERITLREKAEKLRPPKWVYGSTSIWTVERILVYTLVNIVLHSRKLCNAKRCWKQLITGRPNIRWVDYTASHGLQFTRPEQDC